MKKDTSNYYIEPAEMQDLIIEMYRSRGDISEELGSMIMDISEKRPYSTNFINYCVDEKTEALTKRGWLNYQEINEDDTILSCNNGKFQWSKIHEIYRNLNYDGKMHHLTNQGLDALVTPSHKFIVNGKLEKVENIKSKDTITLMGEYVDDGVYNNYTLEFIELVGWCVTEGNYIKRKRSNEVCVFQKEGLFCDKIRNCLKLLGAKYKEYTWCEETNVKGFRITGTIADDLVKVSDNKVLSCSFICQLCQSERMLLIETMINGDGWVRPNPKIGETGWSYCQLDKSHIDNFIMLCTLSGLTTSTKLRSNLSDFSDTPYYNVNIFRTPKRTCSGEHIDWHGGFSNPRPGTKKEDTPNFPTVDYKGEVWCPGTEFGNFVCRRGMYVYVTGKTYTCDMKGDANIKMVEALCGRKYRPYRQLFDENYIWGWINNKKVKIKTNNLVNPDLRCLDSVEGHYWAMVPCKKNIISKIFISESGEYIEHPEKEINFDSVTLIKETDEEYHDNSLSKIKHKKQIYWALPKRLPESCKIYLYEEDKPKLAENNPFSYMTMICTHAFINRIKKEEKNRDAIDRYKEEKYNEFEEENHQIKRSKLSDEEDELWTKE